MNPKTSSRGESGKGKGESPVFPHSPFPLPLTAAEGFTLLEVMVAVVILGLILTTVFGALSRTTSSKEVAEERAELFSNGRQALLRMANEIEASLHPNAGFFFRGDGGGGSGPPELVFVITNRGGFGAQRLRPGSVLVAYSLAPLPRRRGLYALLREEYSWAKLVKDSQGVQDETETDIDLGLDPAEEEEEQAPTEQATVLLDCPDLPSDIELPGTCTPVVGMQLRFFDDEAGDFRDQWNSDEDPTYHRLPAAVEVILRVADRNGVEEEFATIVDLPVARGQPTQRANDPNAGQQANPLDPTGGGARGGADPDDADDPDDSDDSDDE